MCTRFGLSTVRPLCLLLRGHSNQATPMPTTITALELHEHAPFVSSYNTQGFTVQGNKLMGSVALLPKGMFSWKVNDPKDITPESLVLFHLVEPRLELVVLGTGDSVCLIPPSVRKFMQSHRINLEVQDTHNACATFNFLLSEGRMVGAALIPPKDVN